MAAGNYDIYIEQNATFELDLVWSNEATPPVPYDLSTYTAKMQIRGSVGSPTVLAELTTTNGGITLGSEGQIAIKISDDDTLAYTWVAGVYDLFLETADDISTKLLQGSVTVSQAVTII